MATMICSSKDDLYKGELGLYEALESFLPDDCIVYNNREVCGREFDFCVLIPNCGIAIIEVKGWHEQDILRIENGDNVVVSYNGSEIKCNPKKQSRTYRFDLINKIASITGNSPTIFDLVCYPFISKPSYLTSNLNLISEEFVTLLSEDLSSKDKLNNKIFEAYNALTYLHRTPFDSQLMGAVRGMFEPDFATTRAFEDDNDILVPNTRLPYSVFQFVSQEDSSWKDIVISAMSSWSSGVKIYLVVSTREQFSLAIDELSRTLAAKHLITKHGDLYPAAGTLSNNGTPDDPNTVSFSCFNLLISFTDAFSETQSSFKITNGAVHKDKEEFLSCLHKKSSFNYYQYQIEHAETERDIAVKAGAGTGKTYSMVSRIAFLFYAGRYDVDRLQHLITMITFTNEAADNMKTRLKTYFQNYFLLTRKSVFFRLTEMVEKMRISTIHSYAKKMIQTLGSDLGYGYDIEIVGDYWRREIIDEVLENCLSNKDAAFIESLGMPIYQLKKTLTLFASKLCNKSIDITKLSKAQFGDVPDENRKNLHQIFVETLIESERRFQEKLREENSLHLGDLMIKFNRLISIDKVGLSNIKTQYVFIDEFQDTDDIQIDTFIKMQSRINFNFFVVGDLKQCIYRFRGAEENAFARIGVNQDWLEFKLDKNYRSDRLLLTAYEEVFKVLGEQDILAYKPGADALFSDIHLNDGKPVGYYYRRVPYNGKSERYSEDFYRILFAQLENLRNEIFSNGTGSSTAERTIAILVRENWQAKEIQKEIDKLGRSNGTKGLYIRTFTGGDLYRLQSTIDFYNLVLALVHNKIPKYLFGLVSSNYINAEFMLREIVGLSHESKVEYLEGFLNDYFKHVSGDEFSWDQIIESLQFDPVLKIIKTVTNLCKPWCKYSDNLDEQRFYKSNLELLLEKIVQKCNIDYLTINTLEQHLYISIATKQEEESRTSGEPTEQVSIMCTTVHKAKGLEFGWVVLPFNTFRIDELKSHTGVDLFVDGREIGYSLSILGENAEKKIMRNSYYNEAIEKLEREREETRILYVAMTRAIKGLVWLSPMQAVRKQSWCKFLGEGSR
jgi:ATP-dependent exoDNAse (exonuclease V) beta subunit